jgi:hypothetical protein
LVIGEASPECEKGIFLRERLRTSGGCSGWMERERERDRERERERESERERSKGGNRQQ